MPGLLYPVWSRSLNSRTRTLSVTALLLAAIQGATASTWLDTQAQIEQLSDSTEYEEAAALGPRYLEEITQEFGADSRALAEAHLLVARTQRDIEQFDDAVDNALEATRIIELIDGEDSPALIDPLTFLGGIYQLADQHEFALTTFSDARNVSRRNFGLLNQQQLPLMDRMTEAAASLGNFDYGLELQKESRDIVARFHGENSREFLDASYHYLGWLGRLRQQIEHQRAVIQISRLIHDHFDNDPMLRIELLQTTAVIYRSNPLAMQSPERTKPTELELALRIIDRQKIDNPALRAAILRDIGDWYTAFGKTGRADKSYLQAWELLGTLDEGSTLRNQWFSTLVVIRAAPLTSWLISASPSAPQGYVELAFTINADGRPVDISVVDSDPPGLLDTAAVVQVADSVFRPSIVNGRITPTAGRFTWTYRYKPGALEDLLTAAQAQ